MAKRAKPAIVQAGDRFNMLVAVGFAGRDHLGKAKWHFKCDCGRDVERRVSDVLHGLKSCGCLRGFGQKKNPAYNCWENMRARCNNPGAHQFKNYGGRGIRVCERWNSFAAFLSDVGPRPSLAHSLDRIDNDGNYEPGNVRWATRTEQAVHRKAAIVVTYRGREMTLGAACRKAGKHPETVRYRMKHGMSFLDALKKS